MVTFRNPTSDSLFSHAANGNMSTVYIFLRKDEEKIKKKNALFPQHDLFLRLNGAARSSVMRLDGAAAAAAGRRSRGK